MTHFVCISTAQNRTEVERALVLTRPRKRGCSILRSIQSETRFRELLIRQALCTVEECMRPWCSQCVATCTSPRGDGHPGSQGSCNIPLATHPVVLHAPLINPDDHFAAAEPEPFAGVAFINCLNRTAASL